MSNMMSSEKQWSNTLIITICTLLATETSFVQYKLNASVEYNDAKFHL